MSEQLNENQTRLLRLQQLKDAGVIPYADRFDKQQDIQSLVTLGEDKATLADAEKLMTN